MTDTITPNEGAVLELISPENTRRSVPITQSPFLIGRGEVGNQMAIPDRRISRNCAAICIEADHYLWRIAGINWAFL